MLAVRRKSDNVVLYLFPDGQDLRINHFGMWVGMQRAVDIVPETHEIVADVLAPALWVGGAMAWDDGWTVTNQEAYDAAETRATGKARAEARACLVVWVDAFLDHLVSQYPARERDSWPTKAAAAESLINGETPNAVGNALLEREAALMGRAKIDVATLVHAKAMAFGEVVGITAGLRQSLYAQIDKATYAEIPAILEAGKAAARAKAVDMGILPG